MSATESLKGEARFELKRQLADTLQGRIYQAIDRVTGEWVVVKETWKQLVKLGKSRDGHRVPENFEEEKRILKYLSSQKDAHSGFVRLIDEWEDQDCFLYAMEFCRGGELFEYIKGMHSDGAVAHYTRQQSKLQQKEMQDTNEWIKVVQHMFQQIVSVTAWLHSKGVCHLDMSLENAMIAQRSKKYGNQIKIIDFGLAAYYPNNKFINNKRIGKTGYMAPEVFARKKYDPRAADIWSLGVMLFMMLIGAPPYQIPSASNPAFNFIVNGRLRDVLKHWKRLRSVTKEALDLLNKIFKYEANRITMDEILKHPFVNLTNNDNDNDNDNDNTNKTSVDQKEKEEEEEQQQQQQQQQQSEQPQQSQSSSEPQNQSPSQSEPQPQPQPQPQSQPQTVQQPKQQVPKEQEAKPKQEEKPATMDINSYQFTTEMSKKFAKELKNNNLRHDQLTTIMREIEQTHNSLQQKLRRQKGNPPDHVSKVQQQIKELHLIHSNVEQRLESINIDPKPHKANAHTPHTN